MSDMFSAFERAAAAVCGPLGDLAPRCRKLVADYKDSGGQDLHQQLMTLHDRRATDEALVESIRGELAGAGYTLTALAEYTEDGKGRALYLAPGYMEEAVAELGLTMPEDLIAALEAAGAGRPVNWRELVHEG